MATHVGADVVTDFRAHNLADAATYSCSCSRTVARTDRTTNKNADDAALTTTQFYAFFIANFRAVVTTLASADDAAVRRTHGLAVGGTDAQKNCKAHNSTDGLYER